MIYLEEVLMELSNEEFVAENYKVIDGKIYFTPKTEIKKEES